MLHISLRMRCYVFVRAVRGERERACESTSKRAWATAKGCVCEYQVIHLEGEMPSEHMRMHTVKDHLFCGVYMRDLHLLLDSLVIDRCDFNPTLMQPAYTSSALAATHIQKCNCIYSKWQRNRNIFFFTHNPHPHPCTSSRGPNELAHLRTYSHTNAYFPTSTFPPPTIPHAHTHLLAMIIAHRKSVTPYTLKRTKYLLDPTPWTCQVAMVIGSRTNYWLHLTPSLIWSPAKQDKDVWGSLLGV